MPGVDPGQGSTYGDATAPRQTVPGAREQPDISEQHAYYEAIRAMVRGQFTSG